VAKFKLNPLSGFFDLVDGTGGVVVADNFSYEIVTGTVTVPVAQSMILSNHVEVAENGLLVCEGSVNLVASDEGPGTPDYISSSEAWAVPFRRRVISSEFIKNEGLLEVYGVLVL
jgi:hypothetical protein